MFDVRPASTSDMRRFFKVDFGIPMSGLCMWKGPIVVGFGGIAHHDGKDWAVLEVRPDCRCSAIFRHARRTVSMAEGAVYTTRDKTIEGSERFLKRLGFTRDGTYNDQELWVWQG